MQNNKNGQWLASAEAKKKLKVSDCELMHKRQRGELVFQKKGNAYLYYFEENDKNETL